MQVRAFIHLAVSEAMRGSREPWTPRFSKAPSARSVLLAMASRMCISSGCTRFQQPPLANKY
eukprot:4792554-Alexandrium_andersonii.AAC.1